MGVRDNGRLQLWGGVECTVNRLGDRYKDQLIQNGHGEREGDLEQFARLGLEAIRYPLLWERLSDDGRGERPDGAKIDWTWSDRRLARLRSLGIDPIVGLLHHGSGPRSTSLVANDFDRRFAAYAGAVAARYPWIDAYTPINEPLTTARFSGLYGHWYPHGRSDALFVRALLQECRGTVLAMREIRRVRPDAWLIQTENLERVHSTAKLRYQADFENHRRWLSIDLLSGRVVRDHPLWDYLTASGATAEELEWFSEHRCPPDVLGWNYYLTSERFLDRRLRRYPDWSHGGNQFERYADVEAVRVLGDGVVGLEGLLREAWERYRLPMAVTEVHVGCHRESQLRWMQDAWNTAEALRAEAFDMRAVTAWSLLGSFDWINLCTRDEGYYEPGAFDVRGAEIRPTALARLLSGLRSDRPVEHPAMPRRGWWERPERLAYPPVYLRRRRANAENDRAANGASIASPTYSPADSTDPLGDESLGGVPLAPSEGPPILLAGAAGTLGRAFAWACSRRGLSHVVLSRRELDIADPRSIGLALDRYRPWAVINSAGYVRVDAAEGEPDACRAANTIGPMNLARACSELNVQLLTFSTDLVFDGDRQVPYLEHDAARPLNVYGRTKAEAERQVLSLDPRALVVRTSAFFGPWDDFNFLTVTLRNLAAGRTVLAAEDWVISPTYVPDLVDACLDLLIDGESGIWHLANDGTMNWFEFARQTATLAGVDGGRIQGCRTGDLRLAARRPRFSALGSARGLLLPSALDGIRRYCLATERARRECSSAGLRLGPPADPTPCDEGAV